MATLTKRYGYGSVGLETHNSPDLITPYRVVYSKDMFVGHSQVLYSVDRRDSSPDPA
jgi:hypothetical protein